MAHQAVTAASSIGIWSGPSAPYPRESSIHAEFAAAAAARPNATALCVGRADASPDRAVSYGELRERASEVARHLRAMGVAPGEFVGVAMQRSPELVVALLGILEAGAAYVPLDPGYPAERVRFMLGDAGVRRLVTDPGIDGRLPLAGMSVLELPSGGPVARSGAPAAVAPRASARGESPAYVIYTSGSTGQPKGAVVPHRAVLRLVCGSTFARLDASRVVLQLAPVSFDAATFEIWGPLLHGGRLVLYPRSGIPDVDELGGVLARAGVTTLWLTSSLFNSVVDHSPEVLSGVEELLIGGEALSVPHVRKAQQRLGAQLVNGYGPTENTTFTCCYRIPSPLPADTTSIPIGTPIENTRVAILDDDLQPVGDGEPGELCIAGDGLALGYHARPDLTRERFAVRDGVRCYRSGDRVRRHGDGPIEFLGRLDTQVKLHGHRIELGEIESALRAHPDLNDAALRVYEDAHGSRRLAAYVVPSECERAPRLGELRAFLAERLPEYMVPHRILTQEALPLTANGKLDRAALPVPERTRPELEQPFVPPRGPLESLVAEIWCELLALDRVGARDRFFELGGSSLLALRFTHIMAGELGAALRIADFFDAPTVGDVAQVIATRHPAQVRARFGDGATAGPTGARVEPVRAHTRDRLRRRRERRGGSTDV